MNTTGNFTGWVLVHNNKELILSHYQENQETTSINIVETFASEAEMNTRIAELKLAIPSQLPGE